MTAFINKVVMGLRPGPHALLYVLKTNQYTEEDYRVFKQLESLFDECMYYYLIVVITGGDSFEADGISPEDVIRQAPSKLRQMLTDCHNRYIIFNNRAVNKQPQVDKLLGMVREMVKTNGSSPHYRCARYHQFLGQSLEEEVRDRIHGVEERMFQERKEFPGLASIEHFRITLLGKAGSGKSTTGNTILGSKMFKSSSNFSSVTSECKKAEAMVSGTRIEVLDSPRLCDTSSTQEDITAFINKVVMGLQPGSHALLYVLKTDRYTDEDYWVFKQLESLFDECMYYYLIVVITGGDNFEADGISPEDVIRQAPSRLRQVLTDCHNRYIIFNNRAVNKQPQVDKLLGMVREMVKTNGSSPYYRCARYHQFLGQSLEEEVRDRIHGVEERMFQERKEFPGLASIEHFRITLLGKAGSGKSTTGNTILGSKMFKSSSNFSSVTSECKKAEAMVSGTRIEVLDSPRLCDTSSTQEDITAFINKVLMGLRPGPHALLYVLKTDRYTEEDYWVFKQLESLFDERMYDYLIVVFTGGDNFEADGISPEDVIRQAPSKLRQMLTDCHNRYIIFNNRAVNKQPQVDKLLGMIREMVKTNGSSPYYRCTRYHQFLGQPLEEEVRDRIHGVEERMFQERKEFRMHPIQQWREMDDTREKIFFGLIFAVLGPLYRLFVENFRCNGQRD